MAEYAGEPKVELPRRRNWGRFFYLSLIVSLLVIFGWLVIQSAAERVSLTGKLDSLKNLRTQVTETNRELDSLLTRLESGDSSTVEWIARYQWHLARPNERVYQLVPDTLLAPPKSPK